MTTIIEAIDLKAGMIYRLFPSRDWATIKSISYDFRRGAISGVNIKDAEGGGCGIGAYQTVEIKATDMEETICEMCEARIFVIDCIDDEAIWSHIDESNCDDPVPSPRQSPHIKEDN